MNEHLWKIPHPVKVWYETRDLVYRNRKLILGVAGIASFAAILYLRNKRDDTPRFEETLVKMNAVEENAVHQMSRLQNVQDMEQAAGILQDSALPQWQNFQYQIAATKNMKLQKDLAEKRELLEEYAALRVQQAKLLYKAFKENTNTYDKELALVYERINGILDQLQH